MRNRTLARRKARIDNKARLKQAQIERHKTMNGKVPAVGQPDMEVKKFTAAEFKALQQKMQKYQEAANVVNEWLSFLKEQHEVGDNEGWQLGEGCFVRPVKAVEGTPVATAEPAKRPKREPKRKAATADLPPLTQGENVAAVAQDGQLVTEPTL